jgi:hypothetical protein
MTPPKCAAANPAIALWLQSTRPVGRVVELTSLDGILRRIAPCCLSLLRCPARLTQSVGWQRGLRPSNQRK